jgi:uncharacterized integral membrane protein
VVIVIINQAINTEFTHTPARLQWFITATGIVYFAFAYFVPTISAMRNWLATSAALTLAYDVALLAILIRDGDTASLSSLLFSISFCIYALESAVLSFLVREIEQAEGL